MRRDTRLVRVPDFEAEDERTAAAVQRALERVGEQRATIGDVEAELARPPHKGHTFAAWRAEEAP